MRAEFQSPALRTRRPGSRERLVTQPRGRPVLRGISSISVWVKSVLVPAP